MNGKQCQVVKMFYDFNLHEDFLRKVRHHLNFNLQAVNEHRRF